MATVAFLRPAMPLTIDLNSDILHEDDPSESEMASNKLNSIPSPRGGFL